MEPYLRGVTGPRSTTGEPEGRKITRSSRQGASRRKASALGRWHQRGDPITMVLRARGGAEGWIEVRVGGRQERFFVKYDHWVGDLVRQVVEGGYFVEPVSTSISSSKSRRRRGSGDSPH